MKVQIQFNIECGKNTCASEPGKFCQFTGSKSFGTIPFCTLFQEPLEVSADQYGGLGLGWTQRCKACKQQAKLTPGQTGTTSGFPATVVRQYDGSMYEVRVPGGLVCIDQSDFIAD